MARLVAGWGIPGCGRSDYGKVIDVGASLTAGLTVVAGDPVSQRILKDRKYTFVVDDDAGELQVIRRLMQSS
jgi:hypothetical protein